MKIHRSLAVSCLISLIGISWSNQSLALPTEEEVKGVLVVCGGGKKITFKGDIEAKLNIWKRGAEAGGEGSLSELNALFATIPEGEQVNVEAYKNYTSCVIDLMQKYILQDKLPKKSERLSAIFEGGYALTYIGLAASQWGWKGGGKTYLGYGEDPMSYEIIIVTNSAKTLAISPCKFIGEPRKYGTYLNCASHFRKNIADEGDGSIFFDIGNSLGAIKFFNTDKDRELFHRNKNQLDRFLIQVGFRDLIKKIPTYQNSRREPFSLVFVPLMKEKIRQNY